MLVFVSPLRLWIPLACVAFFCVSISPFPLLPPLPPLLGINLFSFPSRRSLCLFFLLPPSGLLLQPSILFTPSLSNQTFLPSSSVYSFFNLPLHQTAESACVNISAALAHLFVHLVMWLEVCVIDLFDAGRTKLSQLLPQTNLRRYSYKRV